MRIVATKYCFLWLVLGAAIGLLVLLYAIYGSSLGIFASLIIVFIYIIQIAIVEFLGVELDPEGLSFPRRLMPTIPFIVVGRHWIAAPDIDRIASVRGHRIRVYCRSSARPEFTLLNSEQKSVFLQGVDHFFPSAVVFRDS